MNSWVVRRADHTVDEP